MTRHVGLSVCLAKNSTNLSDGGNVSGSATSALTLTAVTLSDAAGYTVTVSNLYGGWTTAPATLTVLYPPPYYDGFNYKIGTNLGGQTNGNFIVWADVGTTITAGPYITVHSNNLSVPGLAPSICRLNCIQFGGQGKSARFSTTTVTNGTFYFSFALQVYDTNLLDPVGIFIAGFNNTAGAQQPALRRGNPRLYLHATNSRIQYLARSPKTPPRRPLHRLALGSPHLHDKPGRVHRGKLYAQRGSIQR